MNKFQMDEFLTIARQAGQDVKLIEKGLEQEGYFRITTMKGARNKLSRATLDERIRRSETFLDGLEYRSRIPQGMHDRGEAYVFANHPIEKEKDKRGHNNHFPIYVRTLTVMEKKLEAGEVWDLTVRPSVWGVDEREEMYNIVNVGKLVLESDASVIVHGNAFIFTCQEFIKSGKTIANEYDIGILGSLHGFGYRRGAFDGKNGKNGFHGDDGRDGLVPEFGASFLGPVLDSSFKKEALKGQNGENGMHGSHGEAGLNGGACRIAEINIRSLKSKEPLIIGVIPGKGGDGGNGGDGGDGGNGGNGVRSFKTIEGITEGGDGGDGGNGGDAGNGGRAGHGGISSNVFITVPENVLDKIHYFSKEGVPGKAGKKGKSGTGGQPGKDNFIKKNLPAFNETDIELYAQATAIENGKKGQNGKPGRDGKEGRKMPAAKLYLNGILLNYEKQKINESENSYANSV